MAERKQCHECGAYLSKNSPHGLCPKCLMKVGFREDANVTLDNVPLLEKPGTKIGRYKLLQLIGEGGFGVVYMADQESPVRRRVALKIIKLGMDTKQVVARFEAERQALAMMEHPNIASVFDGGATDTGRPYFVMELVKGIPITEYCDTNNLDTRQRLELFIDVCKAVQHAHQKGIIHRDIKPTNVMVTLHDGKPVPKIIDFGIAKATQHRLTEKTLFTEYKQFIGTPEYMSPEQAEMSGLDVDTRTDVYSLGVLLYELLTGTTPFEAEKLRGAAYDEIRRIIREDEPPKPSTRLSTLGDLLTAVAKHRHVQPGELCKIVRGDLDWVVMKTLEKDRIRRYETASELAQDIQRHLDDEPVSAGPPSRVYRVKKFVRRNYTTVTTSIAILTAIVVGLVVSTVMYIKAEQAREKEAIARTDAENSREKESLARKRAERAEIVAQEQRKLAEDQAEEYRRALYLNRIALAQAEWLDGNIGRVYKLLTLCPKDLRQWEWYRLWHVADDSAKTFRADQSRIVVSPDDKRIISCGSDYSIKVWDTSTGEELMTLGRQESHSNFNCVAFSPDGKRIVSGSDDGTITIWDAETGLEVMSLHGHGRGSLGGDVNCVAYSPDGTRIISGGDDQMLKVWDAETGSELLAIIVQDSNVNTLAFSPDGKRIVSGGRLGFGHLKVWDVETGQELMNVNPHKMDIHLLGVTFSPDGRRFASAHSSSGAVKVWDIQSSSEVMTLHGHKSLIRSIAFSPDGKYILAGCVNGTLKACEVANGREVNVFRGHTDSVESVAYCSDGERIVSGSRDGTIKIWDLEATTKVRTLSRQKTWSSNVVFSPDGKLIALGSNPDMVILCDVETGKEIMTLKSRVSRVGSIIFSPNGKLIASLGYDMNNRVWIVNVWDIDAGSEVATFEEPQRRVDSLTFSIDSKQLIIWCGSDDTLKIWDIMTREEVMTRRGNDGISNEFQTVAFSPDGQKMALRFHFLVKVREMSTGHEITTLYGHHGSVNAIAFSLDSKRIVSGSADSNIKLWDAETGLEIMTLRGHQGNISSLAFSPDGKRIVSGSSDSTVKVWDVETGSEVITLREPENNIASVSFSPDGKLIVSGSEEAINIYDSTAPSDETVSAYLIREYAETGRIDEAKKLLEELSSSIHQEGSEAFILIQRVINRLAGAYYDRGQIKMKSGKFVEANEHFKAAIRLNRDNAYLFNKLAWLQATCEVADMRNGKKAVENANKACELTNWENIVYLSTLAAAYAEAGDFDSAVKWQNKAIDLLPQDTSEKSLALYESRLRLYKAGKPYHESP